MLPLYHGSGEPIAPKAHWLERYTLRESISILATLARFEAERSGVFRAPLLMLLQQGNYSELLDFEISPTAPILDYIHARQCRGFFEKFEPLGQLLKIDRKALAFEKFLASEALCRETNTFFRSHLKGVCFTPTFSTRIFRAKRKVEEILGPCPAFSELLPRLGPGATATQRRTKAVPSYKLVPPFACSPNTVPYIGSIFELNPHLLDHVPHFVEDDDDVYRTEIDLSPGELLFVPKDAKSYRSIVKEPVLTGFYQLAIGSTIERRLRRVGIDIRDQTLNQRLARIGSIDGSLATLDLSSASDTISYELVKFLLPFEWFDLLTAFRSPQVSYHGDTITLEKFSSMGNGFTFPLETLLFYALVYSACRYRNDISVYGDDIICNSDDFDSVVETLSAVGFVPNVKKSFSTGPFRESCGKDWVHGISVRPYRQKDYVSAQSLFVLHNFYKRNYDDEAALLVKSFLHPDHILYGPDGFGDGHLLGSWSPLRHKRSEGWSGFTFETFSPKERKSLKVLPGDYVALLYSVYASSEERYLTKSGRLVKCFGASSSQYTRKRVYTLCAN